MMLCSVCLKNIDKLGIPEGCKSYAIIITNYSSEEEKIRHLN